MKYKILILITLIFLIGCSSLPKEDLSVQGITNLSFYYYKQPALVIRVIDGDTFEIDTGEKVRLICIDPAKGLLLSKQENPPKK